MVKEIYIDREDYPIADNSIIDLLSDLKFDSPEVPYDHKNLSKFLIDKDLILFNILINRLDPLLSNKKEFVEKHRREIFSKYKEQIWKELEKEYGGFNNTNQVYAEWLDKLKTTWNKEKYSDIDEHIMSEIIEPKYKQKILKRYSNHEKLMESRFETHRKRYYKLPEPLNHIDWRTSYDNLFIFIDAGKKYVARGLSGNSSAREIKSRFSYAYALVNQQRPIVSYFLLYSSKNKLLYMDKFEKLCIISNDIGSNYHETVEKDIFKGSLLASFDYSNLFNPKKLLIRDGLERTW